MSVDVAAFQPGSPNMSQTLVDDLGNGTTVTGMEKLAQRFVLELMTSKNSVPQMTQGCNFISMLQAGVSSERDIFTAFSVAVQDVAKRLAAAETANDPADEKLDKVKILRLTVADASLELLVRLKSQAGAIRKVTVPLNFILS